MAETVFYSWQSDTPNKTNRGFIEQALETALKRIRDDDSVSLEPVMDRDTSGVPGIPDIAATIFAKIDAAAVFVCDVTIISGASDSRPCPNPNVLIELGYAKKALSPDRIIMVMNTAYGSVEKLPFDLRMRRVIPYELAPDDEDRSSVRKSLEQRLELGLRAVLDQIAPSNDVASKNTAANQLLKAVDEQARTQSSLARRYIGEVSDRLTSLAPKLELTDDIDEQLAVALEQSIPLAAEFGTVANHLATFDAGDAAAGIVEGFGKILEGYDTPPGFSGQSLNVDFDFHKFMGHELFVTLFASLIAERRWTTVGQLLDIDLYVEKTRLGAAGVVPFQELAQHVLLLEQRNKRLGWNKVSPHAFVLLQRHTEGPLKAITPFPLFVDADLFLFLRSELQPADARPYPEWIPWSVMYLGDRIPRFLAEAERTSMAQSLTRALGLGSIEQLRTRMVERLPSLGRIFRRGVLFHPLSNFDPRKIGTR